MGRAKRCGAVLAAVALVLGLLGGIARGQTGSRPATVAYLPAVLLDAAPTPRARPDCGGGRAAVKSLSDPAAAQVQLTPVTASVDFLRSFWLPEVGPSTPRVDPVELMTFVVQAQLIGFQRAADRSISLLVADPADPTRLVAVGLPDPSCAPVAQSIALAALSRAWTTLIVACGTPPAAGFQYLRGNAVVTGVGFVQPPTDAGAGPAGAPNGFALAPAIEVAVTDCAFVTGPPPTPTASPAATGSPAAAPAPPTVTGTAVGGTATPTAPLTRTIGTATPTGTITVTGTVGTVTPTRTATATPTTAVPPPPGFG